MLKLDIDMYQLLIKISTKLFIIFVFSATIFKLSRDSNYKMYYGSNVKIRFQIMKKYCNTVLDHFIHERHEWP